MDSRVLGFLFLEALQRQRAQMIIHKYLKTWNCALIYLNMSLVEPKTTWWLFIILQRDDRRITTQADVFLLGGVASVRLHLDSDAGEQRNAPSLRQMADKHLLQVDCQFMQLKRQTIQTHCSCCWPSGGLKPKWKAGGFFSSAMVSFCCFYFTSGFTRWQRGELSVFGSWLSFWNGCVRRWTMEEWLLSVSAMDKHAIIC